MKICGKCLHAVDAHTSHNGHFMYCACCHKLCELSEFSIVHTHDNQFVYGAVQLK